MKQRLLIFLFAITLTGFADYACAEIQVIENEKYTFTVSPYLRADVITLNNNIDLDNHIKDDSTAYIGFDYSLGFDFICKESSMELFLKLERNGPYGYGAPLFIHNTLYTSVTKVDSYRNDELLPQITELWADVPVFDLPLKIKSGLYAYEAGNGLSLGGAYENYGLSLVYDAGEKLKFEFYYCRPDLARKSYLGERPGQDKEQGIDYQDTVGNFFALDSNIALDRHTIQPYVGVLIDNTGQARASNFSAPVKNDLLGTFGVSWAADLDKISFNFEAARNFGRAESSDDAFGDVEHAGYAVYTNASYAYGDFSPHAQFIYASGNKVTAEMVDNGDPVLTGGKNSAFSVYSPLNTNLSDSIYPGYTGISRPLVAMGSGYGLNYGIARPGSYYDPYLLENIILSGLGFEWAPTEKISFIFDWWYFMAAEEGVGVYNGSARKLSCDLGNEIDASCAYVFNDSVSLSLSGGYFFPGRFYKEERSDDTGSLFTPFIRGDGKADGAYQIELSLSLSY